MHVHVSTVKRGAKVYRYAQLQECYRRKSDGRPMQRVVANLGALTEQEVANLRLALAASRAGQAVVLPEVAAGAASSKTVVLDNLRYLDVAVALWAWRQWNLDELLAELFGENDEEVWPVKVIAALTLQRLVDPASKLAAQRWFPRTALPELLAIPPAQFNNTRLHRVLVRLDAIDDQLQKRLAARCCAAQGPLAAVFLDATDTWFEGQGPDLAQPSVDKEGVRRRKIGIVLLCDQDGFPLRWEVFRGRESEIPAMLRMVDSVRHAGWVGEAPLVVDRALGSSAQLTQLSHSGLRFVTALLRSEFPTYAPCIPHEALANMDINGPTAADKAAEAGQGAGLDRVSDNLYVRDFGIVERERGASKPTPRALSKAQEIHDGPRGRLMLAEHWAAEVKAGRAASYLEAAKRDGVIGNIADTSRILLKLPQAVRQRIRAGDAQSLSFAVLARIVALHDSDAARCVAFEQHLTTALQSEGNSTHKTSQREQHSPTTRDCAESHEPIRLRVVLSFNPEQFVTQRRRAARQLEKIDEFVETLNRSLASPRSRRTKQSTLATVQNYLRRKELLDAFDIKIDRHCDTLRPRIEVKLERKEAPWQRRRRYDGFSVTVASPDMITDAASLVQLYRSKDKVEKDFQSIKGLIKLRPIRHRTNPKVRAHVTLCMLALLLERTIENRLRASSLGPMTTAAVCELLQNVHLNRLKVTDMDTPVYTVTHASADQMAVLNALGLQKLVDDEEVSAAISSRM